VKENHLRRESGAGFINSHSGGNRNHSRQLLNQQAVPWPDTERNNRERGGRRMLSRKQVMREETQHRKVVAMREGKAGRGGGVNNRTSV